MLGSRAWNRYPAPDVPLASQEGGDAAMANLGPLEFGLIVGLVVLIVRGIAYLVGRLQRS